MKHTQPGPTAADRAAAHTRAQREDEPEQPIEQAGSHPLGTAAGAIGGAVIGTAVGIAAGPVGSLAGAVGGAVAGAVLGSGAARTRSTDETDAPADESIAGEEDPGSSIDIDMPAVAASGTPSSPRDEAEPGTPGTGEAICPRCGGSGRVADTPCPDCNGTGKVVRGIGGA